MDSINTEVNQLLNAFSQEADRLKAHLLLPKDEREKISREISQQIILYQEKKRALTLKIDELSKDKNLESKCRDLSGVIELTEKDIKKDVQSSESPTSYSEDLFYQSEQHGYPFFDQESENQKYHK